VETACPQAVGKSSARLPHQIKDRTAVWPFLAFFDQSGSHCILLHVIPFQAIIFSRSKIAIKIFRLPNRWRNIQRVRELTGADALLHLHPVGHRPRNRCTTCKKMNVIGHENVMTNPQPSRSADRSHTPRKMAWPCAQAKSLRRLCVQAVKNTIGLSRNEQTCGKCRCLIIFTSAERPEGRPSPSGLRINLMRLLPGLVRRGELRVARERAALIDS
jgi:hypothetical protein